MRKATSGSWAGWLTVIDRLSVGHDSYLHQDGRGSPLLGIPVDEVNGFHSLLSGISKAQDLDA